MYAKKNKKPMYGKGGAIKYKHGGQGPDLFGIDAVLEAREKAKNDPNYDPLGLKELVPAAKERISNQMKEAGDSFEEKREAVLNYLVDLFNPSSEKKMMKGGMMPKYPGGGMMPRKRGMMKYENGGEVDPNSPEFKEYLEYRSRGGGGPLYFEEYQGGALSPSELRQMIREQGSGIAIPRSLMPGDVSDRYMNEAMIGYSSGPGGARATMADAMSGAEARFNQNRKFEQEFLEYMKGKGGAAPRREPGMRLEQTPEGELTNAERRLLASFNR